MRRAERMELELTGSDRERIALGSERDSSPSPLPRAPSSGMRRYCLTRALPKRYWRAKGTTPRVLQVVGGAHSSNWQTAAESHETLL
jgi:hypothetical protein